jgi:prepilin-type processing-associated H-X9-DG protein
MSHYSYAYQMPFHGLLGTSYITYPLNSLSDSSMAIMADKNPYLVNTPDSGWALQMYWWKGIGGSKQDERWGNSPNHVMEGQNVLFNDGHVTFHDVPYCGVDDDNIYSITSSLFAVETGLEPWPPPLGTTTSVTVFPNSKIDSLLINEGIQCKDGPQGTAIVPE